MSLRPDVSKWTEVGRTDNATFYEIEPRILAVVPEDGCTDDENTATQSVEFQHTYWRDMKMTGCAVIYMDNIRDSKAGARKVYGKLPDSKLINGFALIGGTVFGRAVASVFIGLSRPSAPTRMFGDLQQALLWARQLNRSGDK